MPGAQALSSRMRKPLLIRTTSYYLLNQYWEMQTLFFPATSALLSFTSTGSYLSLFAIKLLYVVYSYLELREVPAETTSKEDRWDRTAVHQFHWLTTSENPRLCISPLVSGFSTPAGGSFI